MRIGASEFEKHLNSFSLCVTDMYKNRDFQYIFICIFMYLNIYEKKT